jgi:branched-chain amino acid transport system substrate-binding protein
VGRGKHRGTAAAVAALALTLGVVPATGSHGQEQICSWTIGVMGAMSDSFAYLVRPSIRGVELAVELANESGELSCTLQIHKEDTQGDPNQAPAAAQRLVDDEDLVACVCGFFSGETLATGDIFEEGNVAMLSTGDYPGMRKQRFRTWFRLIAPADEEGRVMGIYLRRVLGARRVAIVHDGLDYSREIVRAIADELGWRLSKPMIRQNPEGNGASMAVKEAMKRNPDFVFYGGYANQAWEFATVLREEGSATIPFVSDGGAKDAREARRNEGKSGQVSCSCTDVTEYEDDDEARAFVDAYRERFGRKPARFAAEAFDGTNIVIEALDTLNGTETTDDARSQVVSYLDSYGPTGDNVAKTYSWNDKGEIKTTLRHVFIWEWRRARGFRWLGSIGGLTH